MCKPSIALTLMLCAITVQPARAEDVGALVRPKAELPLREAPPGLFVEKGTQLGFAVPSESYRIMEKKSVPTLLGVENWTKVQAISDPSKFGWIFAGPSSNPSANISRVGN